MRAPIHGCVDSSGNGFGWSQGRHGRAATTLSYPPNDVHLETSQTPSPSCALHCQAVLPLQLVQVDVAQPPIPSDALHSQSMTFLQHVQVEVTQPPRASHSALLSLARQRASPLVYSASNRLDTSNTTIVPCLSPVLSPLSCTDARLFFVYSPSRLELRRLPLASATSRLRRQSCLATPSPTIHPRSTYPHKCVGSPQPQSL